MFACPSRPVCFPFCCRRGATHSSMNTVRVACAVVLLAAAVMGQLTTSSNGIEWEVAVDAATGAISVRAPDWPAGERSYVCYRNSGASAFFSAMAAARACTSAGESSGYGTPMPHTVPFVVARIHEVACVDGVGPFGSCPMQVYASNVSCPTPEVAAVNCDAWEWRMINRNGEESNTNNDGANSVGDGVIQVRPPGYDWGTVCNDGVSETSANKICCALGFECSGATNVRSLEGSAQWVMHIDDMRCGGDEATPGQCPMRFSRNGELSRHDCSDSQHLGIRCELTAEQQDARRSYFITVAVLFGVAFVVFTVVWCVVWFRKSHQQDEEKRLAEEAAAAEQQRQMQQSGGPPGQMQQGYDPNAPPPPPLAGGWAQPPPGGHPDPYAEQPPGYDPYGTQQPAAAPPPQGGYGYGNQAGYPAQQQPQQVKVLVPDDWGRHMLRCCFSHLLLHKYPQRSCEVSC